MLTHTYTTSFALHFMVGETGIISKDFFKEITSKITLNYYLNFSKWLHNSYKD